jgi:hypothetical protein
VDVVDCSEEGTLEVIDRFDLEGDNYPGDDQIQDLIGAGCPLNTIYTLGPTKDSWEKVDDRLVVCFAAPNAD